MSNLWPSATTIRLQTQELKMGCRNKVQILNLLYFHLLRFGKIEHALPLPSIAFIFGLIRLHLLIGIAI